MVNTIQVRITNSQFVLSYTSGGMFWLIRSKLEHPLIKMV